MLHIRSIFILTLMLTLMACNPLASTDSSPVATENGTSTDLTATQVVAKPTEAAPRPTVPHQMPAPLAAAPTALPAEVVAKADADELLLINLYERVNPSVVNIFITVEGATTTQNQLFPTQGQGSGFIYDKEGHVVTNNHVIQSAKRVDVTFADGTTVPAEVVGTDPDSDLAVVKVTVPAESLRPVTWADSDKILVGQRAVAIGNPFGLKGSLTTGIISARGRSLPTADGRGFQIPEILQTDAAINPGNSGGPLLNSQGEVVGVNTAIVPRQLGTGERSFLGVGFAVPANLVQRVVPSLIKTGKYEHPWLGLWGQDVTAEVAEKMQLPVAQGAYLIEIISDSPADKAGLRSGAREVVLDNGLNTKIGGDVITKIGDQTVHSFEDIISYLSRRGVVGEKVVLTFIRDGQERTVELTIQARPTDEELQ